MEQTPQLSIYNIKLKMKYITALLATAAAVNINSNAWSFVKTQDDATFYAAGDQGMTPNGVEYIRTIPD